MATDGRRIAENYSTRHSLFADVSAGRTDSRKCGRDSARTKGNDAALHKDKIRLVSARLMGQPSIIDNVTAMTQILEQMQRGDVGAAGKLLPLVYDELRSLAAARMAHEPSGHTLQPTALVHEAYLRLVGPMDEPRWENRGHFFAAAAEAMRRILIESARARGRMKRGGDRVRLELLDQASSLADDPDLVLSLDDVLKRLETEDSTAARVAHLHLFGGLSVDEAGEAIGLSRPVAYRNWKFARAWLCEALGK